jgi:hypothetical protein
MPPNITIAAEEMANPNRTSPPQRGGESADEGTQPGAAQRKRAGRQPADAFALPEAVLDDQDGGHDHEHRQRAEKEDPDQWKARLHAVPDHPQPVEEVSAHLHDRLTHRRVLSDRMGQWQRDASGDQPPEDVDASRQRESSFGGDHDDQADAGDGTQ